MSTCIDAGYEVTKERLAAVVAPWMDALPSATQVASQNTVELPPLIEAPDLKSNHGTLLSKN